MKMMYARFAFTFLSVVLVSVSFSFGQAVVSPTPAKVEPVKINSRPSPTPVVVAEPFERADAKTMASRCVRLDTEAGVIDLEMFPEYAPESVRNFLNIAALGAFDTTTFSRVVPGFVIQGGNIWTRDGGVSRELGARVRRTIPDEPSRILHERGILSMARSDEPNAATTHFFILIKEAPSLDGKFSAFGRVTKGMDVVDAINKAAVFEEKPDKPVKIRRAIVHNCPTPNQIP